MQVEAAAAAYEALALHEAVEAALAIAARGNLYMANAEPWTAFKKVKSVCVTAATAAC